MNILHDVSLKRYNTFGIEAIAKGGFVELNNAADYEAFATYVADNKEVLPRLFVIGGGSNVVFAGDYEGIVVHPCDSAEEGITLLSIDGDCRMVEARAGVVWDDFVSSCIRQGWYGLENLAGIPGTVGAAPVQNIGAYGKEAKDVVARVHVYDMEENSQYWLENGDCHFGYRHSVFKEQKHARFLVDRVVFKLSSRFEKDLSYKGLADAWNAVDEHEREFVDDATLMSMVVRKVRKNKLPDPADIGSAGSFFKNPVLEDKELQRIREQWPDVVSFATGDGRHKVSAGWLIEQCGWKGRSVGNVGVYERQALVLVNRGGCSGREVVELAKTIIEDVKSRFGITLEPEAIIL